MKYQTQILKIQFGIEIRVIEITLLEGIMMIYSVALIQMILNDVDDEVMTRGGIKVYKDLVEATLRIEEEKRDEEVEEEDGGTK